MEEFDYDKAIAALEALAVKVEDPATGLGDIDAYVREAARLTEQCRAYLRGVRNHIGESFENA
ncbi:MAG: exodeoxyribonuclease VII small subunit [Bacteroidales bacterium]|nr:exodeoxyribonuclease VII small subunit [Bacteroidales bacterium]